MVRSKGELRSELLKTDGSIDVNNVDVNDEDDDIDAEKVRQGREPIPMGFGYVPQMAQVGQGKLPGLPPGVPGGPSMGNTQPNAGFRPPSGMPTRMPNGMMYRGGPPPIGGIPPNGIVPNGIPPQQQQRRAYSLNNVWKQRPRIPHKNVGGGENADDEVVMQESEDDLTFNDIRTMGKSEKYGFEADTAPIIPTLITRSHNNMNNTEYRKSITAQRKHAMNVMARQRKTAQAAVPANSRFGGDPRAMSLQGYNRGNPFNPMGPSGPSGPGGSIAPSGMPRSMSMMTTQSRPPMGHMRQHQQNVFAARGIDPSLGPGPSPGSNVPTPPGTSGPSSAPGLARGLNPGFSNTGTGASGASGPPRNLRLGTSHPVPQTLDTGPLTPDNDHSTHVTSPLKNELVKTSPGTLPAQGGQLNVLQLSQPQQQELREREKQLAEREKELREKEELVKKREAEIQKELKQKEQDLERERLRKDQEELQKQEQKEQFEPSEENQQQLKTDNSSNVSSSNQTQQLWGLSRTGTDEGLDLEPSSTLERGLETVSLNDKPETESAIGDGRNYKDNDDGVKGERSLKLNEDKSSSNYNSFRESTTSFGGFPNNRVSTSTFISALSGSPQKRNREETGLYKLENTGNNDFFTAEELVGNDPNTGEENSTLDASSASTDKNNSTTTLGSNSRLSRQSEMQSPRTESVGGNRKLLSKTSSAFPKENELNLSTQNSSRNSIGNVTMSSFPSSNDDTFDFKQANKDKNSSTNSVPPSKKPSKGPSAKKLFGQSSEPIAEEQKSVDNFDDEMERFSFDNTMGLPYEPVYARGSELLPLKNRFKTIMIPPEQLNILNENKSLMSEISIISAELADSIKRECILEEKIRVNPPNQNSNSANGDQPLGNESLLEYEAQLRTKSDKIVELLKQLNDQRLKRLIAEEQLLLGENGAKPTSTELVHKITDLESQLEARDQEIKRLKGSQI